MNSSHYFISAVSDNEQPVFFDLYGFSLLKQSAHRYDSLTEAVSTARVLVESHRRETYILDANGDVVMVAPMPWRPVSDMPTMTDAAYGWPMSVDVLGLFADGSKKVVTCEQPDSDCAPVWKTACSERWTVTEWVTHWRPLAPGPNTFRECGSGAGSWQ